MKHVHSQNFVRRRKFLLFLPALILPFITLGFWALGGGKSSNDQKSLKSDGLNTKLPDGRYDQEFPNKLSFYDKALRDSIKLAESIKNDPYYKQDLQFVTPQKLSNYSDALNYSSGISQGPENTEKKIMQKLAMLQKELQEPPSDNASVATRFSKEIIPSKRETGKSHLSNTVNSEDPQLKQMEGMLDKILDIQHPERLKNKLTERSTDTTEILVVSNLPNDNNDTGFYSLPEASSESFSNTIQAVVHQTQALVNGSIVKLRLTSDLFIDTVKINRGNFLFGFVTLDNERLQIAVHSIREGHSIFPVNLEVYDLDGLVGIYIPGAISRDVAKQSADNSLQLLQLSTIDPSLKAQATAAGIETAKSLLSKKVKLVKVVVKAGYKVLLKNRN